MKKIIAISLLAGMGAFGLACNGTTNTNTNANRPNANGVSPNLPLTNATPRVDAATPTPHRDMNTVPNSTGTNSATTNSKTNTNSATTNTRTNSASPANRTNSNS